MQTETYIRPPYKTIEEVLDSVDVWDASTASHVAKCPRAAEHKILDALEPIEEGVQMTAGKALHAAVDYYYHGIDPDECIEELHTVWGHDADWRLPPGHRYQHLHLGHLEVIFKNYVDYARKRDTFKPLSVRRDELALGQVLYGVWRMTDDGRVALGESKFIMEFFLKTPNGKDVRFVYSAKPDLPIIMGGETYILDNKTTSSYLSDWYFEQYKHSNQLRGYCATAQALTGLRFGGALINGLYVGEKASSTEFKGARVARYGPISFQPEHINEALLNQYYWLQELYHYHEQGYFQQVGNKMCQSCEYSNLCNASPAVRDSVKATEYRRSPRNIAQTFMSL